ncbi:MAG: 3-keto-disaccharide hydrolase, partial [Vicinamibacterales bacterium]
IWSWPIGSGEVYGYRTDAKMPPAVRAGVTPKRNADRDIGAWNTFEITLRGSRLDVVLNGEPVIVAAELPGVPAEGPIALQHHGARKDGVWVSPPSLVQFRNISIKELK